MKPNHNTHLLIFIMMVFLLSCQNYNWNNHPIARKKRIAKLIRHLDDNPDLLHLNYTPAVNALSYMGMDALDALIPILNSEYTLTRVHAYTAFFGVLREIMKDDSKLNAFWEKCDYNWDEKDHEIRKTHVEQIKLLLQEYKNSLK